MKTLNMKLTEDQMDALHRYACSRLSNKTAVVREWIDSLASSADVQALSRATPAQAVTATTDATVLPQAQGEPSTIGFNPEPVAKRQPNPEFQAALQAQIAKLRAQA